MTLTTAPSSGGIRDLGTPPLPGRPSLAAIRLGGDRGSARGGGGAGVGMWMMDEPDTTWGTIRHYLVSFLVLAAIAFVTVVLACVVRDHERSSP